MENTTQALLNLLERVLGKSSKGNYGNYQFVCPFHTSNPPGKKKLEINLETQSWNCWVCGNSEKSKGKTIKSLFKKIGLNEEYFNELKFVLPNHKNSKNLEENYSHIILPKEFIPLKIDFNNSSKSLENIYQNQALTYLQSRGITQQDILKYNIGICLSGKYENRVIVPSYDEHGKLNYFIARDFTNSQSNYKNPPIKNIDIIGMELYINWDLPIVLVEGIFDFLTLKRNCIPLFGKNISDALMKKIVTSKVKKIYLALDKDAQKDILKYCEELIQMGKEIYWVELDGKDISDIGFKHFLEILENVQPVTFQDLIMKKLKL